MSLTDLPRYSMAHVGDLAELCGLLSEHHNDEAGVVLMAGGTDFMVELSQGGRAPEPLPLVVDISRLDALRAIEWDGHTLRIGAAATYLEMQRHPAVQEHAPLIAKMTYDVGGPTIQARGTLGGNLATGSPAADGVAAIAAFDPVIEVRSSRGSRRIAMADLQTGYKQSSRAADEVIVAIELEAPPRGARWIWRKVGTRLAQAISKVALAAVAEVRDGNITRFSAGMASVGPVTELLANTRKALTGQRLDGLTAAVIDAAIEADIAPIDDVRSTGSYRLHCAKAITRAFVSDLGARI